MLYLYFYSPTFRHFYNLLLNKNEIYKTYIFRKSLSSARDLNGKYEFKIDMPELYAIGIEKKPQENKETSSWPEKLPINVSIKITTDSKKTIYHNIIQDNKIMSLSRSGVIRYVFDHIPLKPGKYTLEVKLIKGDFLDLENTKNILFFYMRPTGFI